MLRPFCHARGETRTLNRRVLSPPPLPVWATRAPANVGTGGETRTHMNRLLRTACLPFAPLPRVMPGEGIEPSAGRVGPRRPQCRAVAFTPPRPVKLAPGEGLEPSSPVPKTGVLPLDDPGRKRTRHDSNVRPQAPQACALILLSYGFRRKVWESNPQEFLSSDSFRDCSACPCPTFHEFSFGCIRRDSNPHAPRGHSFTGCCRAVSASDASPAFENC